MTDEQLRAVMPHAPAGFLPPLDAAMIEFGIDTPLRQAAFLAQIAQESGQLSRLAENLNYTDVALLTQWPRHFTAETARRYGRADGHLADQEMIANLVYAERNGNGDVASGDGWRYRGRGAIQITGKYNYDKCGRGIGIDLVAHPELLLDPIQTCRSAAWFWERNGLNFLADKEDMAGITRRINGGLLGLNERMAYYRIALGVLK
jgi:putative chitinase